MKPHQNAEVIAAKDTRIEELRDVIKELHTCLCFILAKSNGEPYPWAKDIHIEANKGLATARTSLREQTK